MTWTPTSTFAYSMILLIENWFRSDFGKAYATSLSCMKEALESITIYL